jgi:GR25 family glycosyltransferase involved in LPS biosynthesis
MKVLNKAWADKHKLFFLFEDDISFRDKFWELLELAMDGLPNSFDALHLGGFEGEKGELYSYNLIRVNQIFGGYGILFHRSAIKPLLKLLKQEEMQCDMYYTQRQKEGKWFRTLQNLVLHNPGYSTIQKKHVDYPKLRT